MTTFALQTLGCDVAAINTVSFSKSAAQQHVVLSFPIVYEYFFWILDHVHDSLDFRFTRA